MNGMVVGVADVADEETGRRIVACVNALAGRDPAKLEGLVEAARNIADWGMLYDDAAHKYDAEIAADMEALKAALAAFEKGEGE